MHKEEFSKYGVRVRQYIQQGICIPSHFKIVRALYICYYTFWSGVADLSARHPRARSARGGRADKPQHHDKRCDKMFITVDWSLLGNHARNGTDPPK